MMNGGNCNARIVEDIVTTASIGVGYCYWCVPLLLYLFGSGIVGDVEHSVPAFADGFSCWAYTGRSLGIAWSVFNITLWTSEGDQLGN